MKVVDITEKLSFDSNPRLKIRDMELEINGDAETVLKIMGEISEGTVDEKKTLRLINLLLSGESRERLAELKLQFADYQIVLEEAMRLVTGDGDEEAPGEAETRTTT